MHPLSPQLLQAQIVVLPKPGKDHLQCCNNRPISLLNVDLKLFSKIIANHLAPLLPSPVHSDQVGFISDWEARDNTTKTLHYAQHQNIPTCLLACDAEKAFDRVSWPFLQASLQQIGLGPKQCLYIPTPQRKLRLMGRSRRRSRSGTILHRVVLCLHYCSRSQMNT